MTIAFDKIGIEKYSPQKGFGKKSSIKKDLHTTYLDQNIDALIEYVALQVNTKESVVTT
jgi:hypothetical protein